MRPDASDNLVVDLDGSLARINTFRLWTVKAFLLDGPTNRHDRITSFATFVSTYTRRSLRVIDHEDLRRAFITAWGERIRRPGGPKGPEYHERFAHQIVSRHLNERVLDLITKRQSEEPGQRVLLATAAPRFYAMYVASLLNLELCATDVTDDALRLDPSRTWEANAGEAKLAAVAESLQGSAFTVVTDSSADLPLIQASSAVYLVYPQRALVERVRALGKPLVVLKRPQRWSRIQ